MEPASLRRRNRRRLWRVLLLGPPLAVVALFLLSNLWLALPPGRNWVAKKLSARIGLEMTLQRVSWSPWSGITLYGPAAACPPPFPSEGAQPLFKAKTLHLWPDWKSWLKRNPQLLSAEIDSLEVILPIELLAQLSPPPPEPPTLAATAPQPQAPPEIAVADPTPSPPTEPGTMASSPDPSAPPVAPVPISPPSPNLPSPTHLGNTAWVHLENASLKVVSHRQNQELLSLQDLDAALPIAGDLASSSLHIGDLSVAGRSLAQHLTLPVQGVASHLRLGPCQSEILGFPLQLHAQLNLQSPSPLIAEMMIPAAPLPARELRPGITASAEKFQLVARFMGLLRYPSSWQGQLVIESSQLDLKRQDAASYHFDRGDAICTLHGGTLSCVDARLIGDDLSLLGNATLLSDTRHAGVMRIVTRPETAMGFMQNVQRDFGHRLSFQNFLTPDRVATDLEILGNLNFTTLKLGNSGDEIDLRELLQRLKSPPPASP